jgi:type I restriction enzyme S subunit
MNNFKKYPSYKDSEIEWLGEIPNHWDLVKGKWEWRKENRSVRKDDGIVTAFRDGQVTLRSNRREDGFTMANLEHGYQGIRKGDLVIHGMDAFAGAIGVSDSDGKSTPVYSACTPKKGSSPFFFSYLLKEMSRTGWIESLAKGIRERSTEFKYPQFSILEYPIPPLPEQTAIANYLDKKTAEIKEFIALKERTIELLKERKMAIINQAVTKGLDPTVEMKDSGIEWLGEIPKHWEKVRIGHYVNVFRGASPRPAGDPALFGGDFMPWITVSEVTKKGEKYLLETETFLTRMGAKQSRTVLPEMLLLSNSGASLGVPKITLIKGCFNDGSVAFDKYNNKLQRDFLYHFFNSHTEIYRREMAGYGQPNLNTDIIKSTKIPLAPLEEQRSICNYIDSKTEEFNEIIKQTKKEIQLIKEYQQSLISEVVTGKVDVSTSATQL